VRNQVCQSKKQSNPRTILEQTGSNYDKVSAKEAIKPGDRISYGGRYFDDKEVVSLVDSSLDLAHVREYFAEFEKNSGSIS
jgi:CDP-6-deoxy-D-xylo-4-hexulose-3-dehydrase